MAAHVCQNQQGSVQDWNPHTRFILKSSQISTFQLKDWFKSKTPIQEYRNEIQNSYWTCAWIIWYMFPWQCNEIRINHLSPLLVVTMPYTCRFLWQANYIEDFKWRPRCQLGVAFWRVVLREVIVWRAKSRLKGIEDFNLEHCGKGSCCFHGSIPGKDSSRQGWQWPRRLAALYRHLAKVSSGASVFLSYLVFGWPAAFASECFWILNLGVEIGRHNQGSTSCRQE